MKKSLFIFSLIILGFSAQAQYHNATRLHYDMALPVGKFRNDFIDRYSWRGLSIDSRWTVKENITLGFNLGWQVFAQRLENFTQEWNPTTTVTGTQFRTVNTFPIQANMHYYFGQEFGIRPWTGLSIGTAYTNQLLEVGFFAVRNKSWSFALTPQVGVDIPVDDFLAFTVNMRYNYFMQNEVKFDYSFLNFGVGLKFITY